MMVGCGTIGEQFSSKAHNVQSASLIWLVGSTKKTLLTSELPSGDRLKGFSTVTSTRK